MTRSKIKDSGKRKQFKTGSQRDTQEGKGTPRLLPWDALIDLAKHFEEGCKKYGDRDWEKGQPLSQYLDSMVRHMEAVIMGKTDEPHLRAMVWNAVCWLTTKLRIDAGLLPKELDDLPYTYNRKNNVKKGGSKNGNR